MSNHIYILRKKSSIIWTKELGLTIWLDQFQQSDENMLWNLCWDNLVSSLVHARQLKQS